MACHEESRVCGTTNGGAPTKKSERNSSLRRGYSRQVRAAPEKFGGQAPPSIPTIAPVPKRFQGVLGQQAITGFFSLKSL